MGFTHWDWDLATGNGMNNYKMGMGFLFFSGQQNLLEKAYFIFELTGLWQQSGRPVLTLKATEMESGLRLSAAQARKGGFLQFSSRNFSDPTISEPGTG